MTKREENLARARKIERHLRPATLPVGIKFWKNGETIPKEAGTPPKQRHAWCQFVSIARCTGTEARDIFLVKKE